MSDAQTEAELKKNIESLPKEDPKQSEGLIRELYKNISEIADTNSKAQLLSSLKAVSSRGLSKEMSKKLEENGLHMEGLALVLNYLTTRDELAQYLFATSEDEVEKDGLTAVKKRLGPKLEVLGGLRANGVDVTKEWVVKLVRAAPSLQSLSLLSERELQNIYQGQAISGEISVVNSLVKNAETRKKIAAGGGEVDPNDASGKAIDQEKLEKAKALMKEAKEVAKQQSDEAKKVVNEKVAEITKLLELPSDWNKQDDGVKPEKLLGDLNQIVDQLVNVAVSEEYKSDLEIVWKASGGRALCGIYHSKYVAPITAELPIVELPNEVTLSSPNNSLDIKYVKFLKSGFASDYVQKVTSSSTSVGVSIAGFYGAFVGEVSGSYASRKDQGITTSEKRQTSSASVVQSIWIATKTFKIKQDQLKLTEGARNMVVKDEATARLFMQRYGSHFPAGLQTLGGVLFRIADVQSSSTKSASEITEKAAQQLQSQLSVGFLGGAGGIGASVTSENSSSSGSVRAQEEQTEDITYTFTSQAMGPAASDPTVFSKMLSNNSTWALIDRGSQRAYLPVWELLRYLGKAFEAPAEILEKTWRKDEDENKKRLEEEKELQSKVKTVYVSEISFVVTEDAIDSPLPNMIEVDMNKLSNGKYIYPIIHYSDNKDDAISGLKFIQDDELVPSGYTKIEQDLNEGAGGNYNYLCTRKGGENKMTAVDFTTSKGPLRYVTINYYFRFPPDLNDGGGGDYIYLLYKTNTGKPFSDD